MAAQRTPVLFVLGLLQLAVLASCDDPPTSPTSLSISCPGNVAATSRDGRPTEVTYTSPTTSGGTPPVSATCTPASGSTFPLGSTTVSCTATDQRQRTASCSFTVTVAAPPFLAYTKFLAFGDSITEGQDGTRSTGSTSLYEPRVIVPYERSYPGRLQESLRERYIAQLPVVDNRGRGGETTRGGRERLPEEIAALQPEVVLLLEGANDLALGDADTVPRAADNLRAMVRDAQARRVRVFLATLTPQREGGPKAGGAELVPLLNDEIREIAVEENATFVDVYAAFGGDLSLISADGLHPTEAGFERMAEAFFEVIRRALEVPFPQAAPDAVTTGGAATKTVLPTHEFPTPVGGAPRDVRSRR